jgi:integrase
VGARERAGIKPNTIVRDLRVFRAMLRKARPDLKVPAELFPAENLTRVRMLTPEQRAEVFPLLSAMCGERFALIAALAMLGIMRLTEVRTLRREMIHLPARVILLPRTKGRKPRPRVVRLSDEAVTLVTRALLISPHPSWVFPNAQSGEPYSRVHISRCWRKAARACGLAGFTFHDLRHHGPTVAVNAGANSATLKAMGGWLSDASMQRYTHVLNPTVDAFMGMITTRPSPA